MKKMRVSAVSVVIVILAIGLFAWFVSYASGLDKPRFGSQMMNWADELETKRGDFKFIGDMSKQVYYPKDDPRASRIPADNRVYFVDETTARSYSYRRG